MNDFTGFCSIRIIFAQFSEQMNVVTIFARDEKWFRVNLVDVTESFASKFGWNNFPKSFEKFVAKRDSILLGSSDITRVDFALDVILYDHTPRMIHTHWFLMIKCTYIAVHCTHDIFQYFRWQSHNSVRHPVANEIRTVYTHFLILLDFHDRLSKWKHSDLDE